MCYKSERKDKQLNRKMGRIHEQVTIEEEVERGNKHEKIVDLINNVWKQNERLRFYFKPNLYNILQRYRKLSAGENVGSLIQC